MPDLKFYPLADPRGNSIPFDVGDPSGLAILNIGVAASAALDLSGATDLLATLFATVDTIVSYGTSDPVTTAGSLLPDQSFIPANSSLVVLLPATSLKCISADGVSTGKLYINLYNKWQALGKDIQGVNF